jgi:hypothetical protein
MSSLRNSAKAARQFRGPPVIRLRGTRSLCPESPRHRDHLRRRRTRRQRLNRAGVRPKHHPRDHSARWHNDAQRNGRGRRRSHLRVGPGLCSHQEISRERSSTHGDTLREIHAILLVLSGRGKEAAEAARPAKQLRKAVEASSNLPEPLLAEMRPARSQADPRSALRVHSASKPRIRHGSTTSAALFQLT